MLKIILTILVLHNCLFIYAVNTPVLPDPDSQEIVLDVPEDDPLRENSMQQVIDNSHHILPQDILALVQKDGAQDQSLLAHIQHQIQHLRQTDPRSYSQLNNHPVVRSKRNASIIGIVPPITRATRARVITSPTQTQSVQPLSPSQQAFIPTTQAPLQSPTTPVSTTPEPLSTITQTTAPRHIALQLYVNAVEQDSKKAKEDNVVKDAAIQQKNSTIQTQTGITWTSVMVAALSTLGTIASAIIAGVFSASKSSSSSCPSLGVCNGTWVCNP